MKPRKSVTNQFLIDTNVFIASIKNPGRKTGSLDLILNLIANPDINLVGNDLLLLEFEKYHKRFNSMVASRILKNLKHRIKLVEVKPIHIKKCAKYMPQKEIVDIVHAATCLQEDAVLISNDKHFTELNDAGIIEVWTMTKAIEIFVKNNID